MTTSRQLFIKVKLWFAELMNLSITEQETRLKKLYLEQVLNKSQITLLKEMLAADNRKKTKTQAPIGKAQSEHKPLIHLRNREKP